MNAEERYTRMQQWLLHYIDQMAVQSSNGGQAYALKRFHSLKVAEACLAIGRRMQLEGDKLLLAGVIGLLHDLGRFEQYRTYGTFNDYRSVDHGDLGARTLEKNGILEGFDPRARSIIIEAVRRHNKLTLPQESDPEALFYTRLVRDADKLDIYRVVVEEIAEPGRRASFWPPPGEEVAETLYRDMLAGRPVSYRAIRNSTEMHLMQLSWIYDINFDATLQLIGRRGYFAAIAAALPAAEPVQALAARIRADWEKRIARAEAGAHPSLP